MGMRELRATILHRVCREESKPHSFTYSTTLGHFDGPVTGINRRGLSGQALVVLAGLEALSKARIMFRTLRVWATM